MPFEKVETTFDLPALEREILRFWEQTQAFEKLRKKIAANRNGRFSTVRSPPTIRWGCIMPGDAPTRICFSGSRP
jgi:isoleucyl-tRNA synthetase